jgi:hypothetical protein
MTVVRGQRGLATHLTPIYKAPETSCSHFVIFSVSLEELWDDALFIQGQFPTNVVV